MRKRHSPDFKAKAVLEALKEERPLNQIASDLEVHPNMLSAWKASAVKGLATLFERENSALADKEADDSQRKVLYAEIGKVTTPDRRDLHRAAFPWLAADRIPAQ